MADMLSFGSACDGPFKYDSKPGNGRRAHFSVEECSTGICL